MRAASASLLILAAFGTGSSRPAPKVYVYDLDSSYREGGTNALLEADVLNYM